MDNSSSPKIKIITVEDSPIVVERMQSMLKEIAFVDFRGNATNISSALSLIGEEQPHVVILDISLEEDKPKANGINLLIELRQKYSDVIIIMFTNLVEPQYRNTCMVFGANYFFDKSNDFEKIPEALKEVIQLKKISDLKNDREGAIIGMSKNARESTNQKQLDEAKHDLEIANKELQFQNKEKKDRADELIIANKELQFQIGEKKNRADESIAVQNKLELEKKRTEELTKAYKEISDYKYAIDASAIVTITDQKGIIHHVNDNFCTISKYSREELIGQDHRIINSGYHSKEFIGLLWKTIANGKIWKGELRNKAKDGSIYWVDTTIVPFLNEKGKPYQYVAIRSDITESKKLEEQQAMFALIVNSSDDAIISKNLAGTITSWNHGAEKMFGYSEQEISGKDMSMLIPQHLKNEEKEIMKKIKSGKIIDHHETVRARKDGTLIHVSLTISPIKDASGSIIGASKIARDITEQKNAAQAVAELNINLEQKVEERTAQLNIVNKELEAFTYSVSHDLRTPLRGISGYASMLEEDYYNLLDADGKRILIGIRKSSEQMGQLIDDLLAFARLGRQEIAKARVEMTEQFNAALKEISKVTPHTAEIVFQQLHPAQADNKLILQVATNLLSNAIKYSSKVDHPKIEISSYENDEELVYRVRDNGAGFNMKYVSKLFEVFHRLHSNEEFEGTGVGLAIVKRIIQKHGGKVWAEGEEGIGSTFYFSLPQKQESQTVKTIDTAKLTEKIYS